MKGMKLDKRDQREMLQLAGGWDYDGLVKHLRIYSPYFVRGGGAAHRDGPSSRSSSSTRSVSSFRSSSAGGSRSGTSVGSRFSRRSNRVNAVDNDDVDGGALDPVSEGDQEFEDDEGPDDEAGAS